MLAPWRKRDQVATDDTPEEQPEPMVVAFRESLQSLLKLFPPSPQKKMAEVVIRPLLEQVTADHIRDALPKFRAMFDEWEKADHGK